MVARVFCCCIFVFFLSRGANGGCFGGLASRMVRVAEVVEVSILRWLVFPDVGDPKGKREEDNDIDRFGSGIHFLH